MIKFSRTWKIVTIIVAITGCAVPIDPRLNATGVRNENRTATQFSQPKELLLAGLVDDGLGLAVKNRFFEAEGRLRQALYLDPKNDRVLYNLALILNQTTQSEEAEEILLDLNARKPGTPDILFALSDTKAALSKYDEALQYLKEIFKILKRANEHGPYVTCRSFDFKRSVPGRD